MTPDNGVSTHSMQDSLWTGRSVRRKSRASRRRASGEREHRCTSPQQNAHITETREVQYPWHSWYGKAVYIFGVVAKSEHPIFRCALDRGENAPQLEIPQWMFDAAACCGMTLVETASVSVGTLRDLTRLICAVEGSTEIGVLQGKHLTLPDAGGACARPTTSKSVRSTDDLPSSTAGPTVDQHADRGTGTNDKASGATAACASPGATRRAARRRGGVR